MFIAVVHHLVNRSRLALINVTGMDLWTTLVVSLMIVVSYILVFIVQTNRITNTQTLLNALSPVSTT